MGRTDDRQSANGNGESPASSLLHQIQGRLAELGEPPEGELVARAWAFQDDLYVVALAGEMDMSNVAELTDALDQLGSGPCELIIDLSRLTFIDSSGINQLVKVTKTLDARGGRTVLVAPTPIVARVLEIVRMEEFTPVVESLEVALTHVRAPASPGTDTLASRLEVRAHDGEPA